VFSVAKRKFLFSTGHVIATGGPGSGKTHIALLKGDYEHLSRTLQPGQKMLFMSFARSTVARIEEQLSSIVSAESMKYIEITTYHGLAWRILKSHGYLLLNQSGPLEVIPPPEAAAHLSSFNEADREREINRLFDEERRVHFDLFSPRVLDLLTRSSALLQILSSKFPIIVLDEFQDTNQVEWELIKLLGTRSRMIALADPQQRIYRFRGADPNRIEHFRTTFQCLSLNFDGENYRSDGRDINDFGNDLVTGGNKSKSYNDVSVVRYRFYRGLSAYYPCKTKVLSRLKSLTKRDNWSIAILVPTRQLMLSTSQYLSSDLDGLPSLQHEVSIDSEGPCLAAFLIASLLEHGSTKSKDLDRNFLFDFKTYLRGRKGTKLPSQEDLGLIDSIEGYLGHGRIRGSYRSRFVEAAKAYIQFFATNDLTGHPEADWNSIIDVLIATDLKHLNQLVEDAKYARLLQKGALLRATLAESWRTSGTYANARLAFEAAYRQEYFATKTVEPKGILVTTLHKSKGKQFSEVILYEGAHQGRFLRDNVSDWEKEEAIYTLRVGVTRASEHATILTPNSNPSTLL